MDNTSITDYVLLKEVIDTLWNSLGSGVWLEPGDYEVLRKFHNEMAQAAEDVCIVAHRFFEECDEVKYLPGGDEGDCRGLAN